MYFVKDQIAMKQPDRINAFLHRIHMFPLSLLNLSLNKRLLIVILSYGLGVSGLWFSVPHLHNEVSMILPIICTCWLFRYRGVLVSICSTALTIWLTNLYLWPDTWLHVIGRTILGLGIALILGLMICWLRIAVDLVHVARQQAITAEEERLQALQGEREVTLAYEQQRKINELKDQFLLNVSHELRTPLMVLGGSLELLKEYHESLDPAMWTQMLTQALASQQALVDLVNRVLDTTIVVSEIPLAKSEVIYIHQLIQEVLAHQAPGDVEAYTICLQAPEQMTVWADPQLLRQVLQNLLSNVFKYVPKQTELRIEATQVSSSSPVCLSVQDAGPGIPAEELPLLFEKFVRLKRDMAGSTRGTGLGLYICRRLVEAMEGRIWVESSGLAGEGSRFCVTLPAVSPS